MFFQRFAIAIMAATALAGCSRVSVSMPNLKPPDFHGAARKIQYKFALAECQARLQQAHIYGVGIGGYEDGCLRRFMPSLQCDYRDAIDPVVLASIPPRYRLDCGTYMTQKRLSEEQKQKDFEQYKKALNELDRVRGINKEEQQ